MKRPLAACSCPAARKFSELCRLSSHTVQREMRSSRARLQKIDRKAALTLVICVGSILAASCLVLALTVWRPEPVEKEPFYTTLPGVDMAGVPPEKAEAMLKKLNVQRCPCECMRTIASCRNHHDSCQLSLGVAREAVKAAKKH